METMLIHGFPQELVDRVSVLQACEAAYTRTPYGCHPVPRPITTDCKQGCPLSPIRFCLFIDMFYHWLHHAAPTACYSLGSEGNQHTIAAQAWMDTLPCSPRAPRTAPARWGS